MIIVWMLVAILSPAWGCGLEDLCRTDGIENRTVDPFSDIQVSARCSGPDASTSSWYIRRYMNGNDSLDGLGAPLTLNDSFRQNGNELTIRKVNGFAEGTYHCGVDNNTIQPASLCLFVQGRPFFISCPGEFGECPGIMQIAGTPNGNVLIDTRISFTDGGSCKMTKRIRDLEITKLNEENEVVYFCSNLINFSSQLCNSSGKFRVKQQRTCIEPDITFCKYDMKLVLWNFNESDEGIYNITVNFDNPNLGRGMLRQQFNLSSSDGSFTTSFTTSFNASFTTSFNASFTTSFNASFTTSFDTASTTSFTTTSDSTPTGDRTGTLVQIVVPTVIVIVIVIAMTLTVTIIIIIIKRIIMKRDVPENNVQLQQISPNSADSTSLTDAPSQDKTEENEFLSAVEKRNLDIVSELIEKGINLNFQNEEGKTALLIASKEGRIEIVKLLLKKGASVDHQDKEGWSSLILASYMGHDEVVRVLLDKKAKVDLCNKMKWSALMNACHWRYGNIAEMLLANGAPVNQKNDKGMTPLMDASSRDFKDIMKLLLDHGAKLNFKNKKGESALSLAIREDHTEAIKLLLDKGSTPNDNAKDTDEVCSVSSRDEFTGDPESFLYAASIGNLDTVSKKIRQEIDIDSMNEEGKTALMLASMKGHTDIAKLLLTNGASVEKKDKNQWSPLMWAIYGGSIEMIKLLLRENNQAQVGLCNSMGYSALFIACEWNNIDAAKLLLKKGAPVDLLNNKGMSPLMDACLHARTEIIKLLLEYDADVNLKNKKGQSARSFARHDEIISLLPEGVNDNAKDIDEEVCSVNNGDESTAPTLIKVKCPNMLAVTDDKVVIVGDSSNHVNIYSKGGKLINSFKLKGEKKPKPRGVLIYKEHLFITDKQNKAISRYDFSGDCKEEKKRVIGGNCGIAVNSNIGHIYIADEKNCRIRVLDSNLELLKEFGTRGYRKGEFDFPRDVAVANDGSVYVTDRCNNRVQVFSADGEYTREFGNDELKSPVGVCIDSNGHVLVADHDNQRVCIFNLKGELLTSFAEDEDKDIEFTDLIGIAVDNEGKIYTADYGGGRVQSFLLDS